MHPLLASMVEERLNGESRENTGHHAEVEVASFARFSVLQRLASRDQQ